MPTERHNDPAAFRAFLDAKLADRGNELTLAEILALWEAENQTDAERDEAHRRVDEGLGLATASPPSSNAHTSSDSRIGP